MGQSVYAASDGVCEAKYCLISGAVASSVDNHRQAAAGGGGGLYFPEVKMGIDWRVEADKKC